MNHAATDSDVAHGTRLVVIGLFVNALLAVVKMLAGVLGHSHALVADGVESLSDIFASIVVWGGIVIASRPADSDHPYGHDRAESLATMVVAWMLLAAALVIAIESVREILTPHRPPAAYTLVVLLVVVVIKEVLFRVMARAARVADSGVIHADAWHHRSDAITSAAAAVGIAVALFAGPAYAAADDWAALVAAGVITWNGVRLMRPAFDELMDRHDEQLVQRVRSIACELPGVHGIEKVFTRRAGRRTWVDLHLEVAPDSRVDDAHRLAHQVKDAIKAALP
ncbi:MAG: cation diffusion facilitator family transporter, partial [Phycisphaerae bacterium]